LTARVPVTTKSECCSMTYIVGCVSALGFGFFGLVALRVYDV
jgi:hypothetical protein